jgi:hypothetical protein
MGQTPSTAIQAAPCGGLWETKVQASATVLAPVGQGVGIDKYLFSFHMTSVPN